MQLPGRAFADGCHAGRFARCVLLRLLAKGAHSSSYGHFLVRNKDGALTSFVDMGVYTRNRCADTGIDACRHGVRGREAPASGMRELAVHTGSESPLPAMQRLCWSVEQHRP